MAASTALKRACLDDAYDRAVATSTALRVVLRSFETAVRQSLSAGSIRSNQANGHTTELAAYGPGNVTLAEMAELWRGLIDLHDQSRRWIAFCFLYALDPDQAEIDRIQSTPTTTPINPAPAVVDLDIYEWMMGSNAVSASVRTWPGKLIAITEIRSDYSLSGIQGAQWV